MVREITIWGFLLLSSIFLSSCRKRDETNLNFTRERIYSRARVNNSDYVYKVTYNAIFGPTPNDPTFVWHRQGYISTIINLSPENSKSDSISFALNIAIKPWNLDSMDGETFIITPDSFWLNNNTTMAEEKKMEELKPGTGIIRVYTDDQDQPYLPSGVLHLGHRISKDRYPLKYEVYGSNMYLGNPANISGELSINLLKSIFYAP